MECVKAMVTRDGFGALDSKPTANTLVGLKMTGGGGDPWMVKRNGKERHQGRIAATIVAWNGCASR